MKSAESGHPVRRSAAPSKENLGKEPVPDAQPQKPRPIPGAASAKRDTGPWIRSPLWVKKAGWEPDAIQRQDRTHPRDFLPEKRIPSRHISPQPANLNPNRAGRGRKTRGGIRRPDRADHRPPARAFGRLNPTGQKKSQVSQPRRLKPPPQKFLSVLLKPGLQPIRHRKGAIRIPGRTHIQRWKDRGLYWA